MNCYCIICCCGSKLQPSPGVATCRPPHRKIVYQLIFNVENVILRGYKWNETVSNRIRNVSNEMCNTSATSYITADYTSFIFYYKLYVSERIKNNLSKNDACFIPQIIVHCLNNYPKHVIIFHILQTLTPCHG
jgi:hypothetical protein